MPGDILKKKREELGYNLKEIAKTLRIRADYLKAIEEENFEKLPVEVYTKGYIREYARFLKTDPETTIKAYIDKISPPAPPVTEKQHTPAAPAENTIKEEVKEEKKSLRYPAIAIALFIMSAAVLLTTLFLFVFKPEKPNVTLPEITAAVSPVLQPGGQAQDQKTFEKEKMEIAPNSREQKVANEHTLEILASDTTWLLVTIDHTESKELLLNKGESVKLSAKNGFSLKIGNAGGIKLIFDGKDMGAPGENGKVITLNLPSGNNTNL